MFLLIIDICWVKSNYRNNHLKKLFNENKELLNKNYFLRSNNKKQV
jgi:hypothetical protein